MATGQWARLRPSEAGHLRRGAWYRVIRLTPVEAVLDVNGTLTAFPRPTLEILPTPPTAGRSCRDRHAPRGCRSPGARGTASVPIAANGPPRRQGDQHAVPKCNGFFDIGWDNSDVAPLALITILFPRPFSSPSSP